MAERCLNKRRSAWRPSLLPRVSVTGALMSPRGLEIVVIGLSLFQSDARVEEGVGEVNNEVDYHKCDCSDECDGLNDGEVAGGN